MKIILQLGCFRHKFLSIQFSYRHECNSLTIFNITNHADFTVWSRIDPEKNRIWYLAVKMVVKSTAISKEDKVRQILVLDSIYNHKKSEISNKNLIMIIFWIIQLSKNHYGFCVRNPELRLCKSYFFYRTWRKFMNFMKNI